MIDVKNKRVLLIGSGWDIAGRRMGKEIDYGKRWDIVARVNRVYGDPQDVGSRTDIFFTRWRSWLGNITPDLPDPEYIFINEEIGITRNEYNAIRNEVGTEHVSAGTIACAWLLNRGAIVDAVGFGYDKFTDSFYPKAYAKRYKEHKKVTESGGTLVNDKNEAYDFKRENLWILTNDITLL